MGEFPVNSGDFSSRNYKMSGSRPFDQRRGHSATVRINRGRPQLGQRGALPCTFAQVALESADVRLVTQRS